MENCFFCGVEYRNGVNPVISNSEFTAIFDKAPVNKGHTLVIPKMHYESFFDMPLEMANKLYFFLRETKERLDKQFHPDGYNIGINDGRAAGRTIDHLHLHVIPRYVGDMDDPKGGVRNVMLKPIPPAKVPDKF